MAAQVSLKRTKAEIKKYDSPSSVPEDYYPVSMYLSTEEVKALGIADCDVGEEFDMTMHVRVTSKSSSASEGGSDYSSMTLTVVSAVPPSTKKTEGDLTKVYNKTDAA